MTPWQVRTSGTGIHSIPEMHTTHKHIEGFNWQRDETLRHSWEYATGQRAPNYHVPAVHNTMSVSYMLNFWGWMLVG